jgi:hypothetical protein
VVPQPDAEAAPTAKSPAIRHNSFVDDEILPVFEADLDLPRLSAAAISPATMEERR